MKVSPYGLAGEQWAIAIGAGISTWIAAFLFKLVPDRLFPQFGAKDLSIEPLFIEKKFNIKDRILSSRVSQLRSIDQLSQKRI